MTTTSKTNNTRNKLASSVRRAKTTQAEKKTATTAAKTATKSTTARKAPAKKAAPVGSSENPVKANAEKLATTTGQRVWPD